jgi:glycogenin glucosyltransferase
MPPPFAFVTLLTSDSYLPGALTSINSLLDVEGAQHREFDTVCLVTPSTVGQASIKALQNTFDCVIGVAEITTESWRELDLLGMLSRAVFVFLWTGQGRAEWC